MVRKVYPRTKHLVPMLRNEGLFPTSVCLIKEVRVIIKNIGRICKPLKGQPDMLPPRRLGTGRVANKGVATSALLYWGAEEEREILTFGHWWRNLCSAEIKNNGPY